MTDGYLSLTERDRDEMLAAIGVSSIDDLFEQIPEGVRFDRELDVPPGADRAGADPPSRGSLAAKNSHTGIELSFLGAGIYDHHTPAIVDTILQRGEFLTAYTPYQPEMSQGVLQAIFEYQTAICELTGMDVSNASGYDGFTVAADACYIAKHATGRTRIVLAETLNPQVREVVKTYAPGFGLEIVEVPHEGGVTDPERIAEAAVDAAAVLFPQPNFFGCLEDAPALAAAAREAGALAVAHVDLTSLGVLEAPGRLRLRHGDRRGTVGRQRPELRRPALRLPRLAHRVHPPAARPDRRPDDRPQRRPRLRAHAADARAAHPPREGDVEHDDQPDAARARRSRHALLARPAGIARARGDLHGARRATRGSGSTFPPRSSSRSSRSSRCGRREPAREVVREARALGVHPGYALGRDYEGMDDVLLVALTEKRTPADIDRLADVLAEVCG